MNEEINCITNDGKVAKNEWQNDDSDFFWLKFGQPGVEIEVVQRTWLTKFKVLSVHNSLLL